MSRCANKIAEVARICYMKQGRTQYPRIRSQRGANRRKFSIRRRCVIVDKEGTGSTERTEGTAVFFPYLKVRNSLPPLLIVFIKSFFFVLEHEGVCMQTTGCCSPEQWPSSYNYSVILEERSWLKGDTWLSECFAAENLRSWSTFQPNYLETDSKI